MKILVTGATGFLGKALTAYLRNKWPSSTVIEVGSKNYDLTDPVEANAMMCSKLPMLVYHCAARVGGIEANRKQPGTFFRDNMLMGINVLEAARKAQALLDEKDEHSPRIRVVMIGTCCSYPSNTDLPIEESMLWNGYPEPTNAPYGIAKRALTTMADAYRQEFGMDVVTVIPANLYGPGDHFDLETSHVIPGMIHRFLQAKYEKAPSVTLWGTGEVSREFLYVDDAVAAIEKIGREGAWGPDSPEKHVINIGTGDEIMIWDLALTIKRAVGYDGAIIWDESKPNGQHRRILDTNRAAKFGIECTTTLDAGLRKTIDWFLENRRAEP